MLVLTRKLQEEICIGDNVTISVLKIKGNTVRIGINAPPEVRVLRGEIPRFDTDPEREPENVTSLRVDRKSLGFEHQPIVREKKSDDDGRSVAPSSQLRLLVQQVVSTHAV